MKSKKTIGGACSTSPESAGSAFAWTGEKNRPLSMCRPCKCGCDRRGGNKGVGYLTGSDAKGRGFTVWIESEAVFKRIAAMMPNKQLETKKTKHERKHNPHRTTC